MTLDKYKISLFSIDKLNIKKSIKNEKKSQENLQMLSINSWIILEYLNISSIFINKIRK